MAVRPICLGDDETVLPTRRVAVHHHTASTAAGVLAPLLHELRFHHALPPDRTHCACLRCENREAASKGPITRARPLLARTCLRG